MPTVHVNGIDLYYEEYGAGEPLLLIMGWGGNAAAWKPQLPGLATRHHVIAYDNRGAGRSSAPCRPYNIRQLADDAAALLDALEIPSANVFGVSMGGMIAQELALQCPDRVNAVVLGCTSAGGANAAGTAELRSDIATLRATLKRGAPGLDWFTEFIHRLWTDEAITRADPYLQDFIFALIRYPPKPHGLLCQARAVANHDTYDRLVGMSQPTLVLTGDQDGLIACANSEILARGIPNASLQVFPGLKHAFHLEQPHDVNEVINAFFDSVSAPNRTVQRLAGPVT
jgi:pimeloyl-ACP methyl ester carboxylesterase